MKRTDFANIVEIMSVWKIDARKGDYRLPNGELLSSYIYVLIDEALTRYNAMITASGNIHKGVLFDKSIGAYRIEYYSFTQSRNISEIISLCDAVDRVEKLAKEIVERRCRNYD